MTDLLHNGWLLLAVVCFIGAAMALCSWFGRTPRGGGA